MRTYFKLFLIRYIYIYIEIIKKNKSKKTTKLGDLVMTVIDVTCLDG